MAKRNCWEVKQCGRQPGGINAKRDGICPAATLTAINGTNGGLNGGRACWALTGTMSGPADKVQGTFARDLSSCYACKFYEQVMCEELDNFEGTVQIVRKLRDRIAQAANFPFIQPGSGHGTTEEEMRAGS
ncbi:two-CW domain-containing protein [Candidatus Electronema sp. PJ]|uniref:two-CW domain-containing protein n=1 Tax=Candidatus Electronema sp. PJ TaxID=3401572 RepID=UPI003AA83351